ncbi:hypothetical protein AAMO2058_001719000 [Amorphochlora amoebiformis]
MLSCRLLRSSQSLLGRKGSFLRQRYMSTAGKNIRNIGIIAHVDAGKTTTTERMLFYAGKIRNPGDVDTGTTVTDFLVERAVRVLDGAVAIVDAVSGVQAQTETVWRQADRHNVPRILFINKMDRDDGSVERSVESLKHRLPGKTPLIIQVADVKDGSLERVVDIRTMQVLEWQGEKGQTLVSTPLSEYAKASDILRQNAANARTSLLEMLAEVDDEFCELFLPFVISDTCPRAPDTCLGALDTCLRAHDLCLRAPDTCLEGTCLEGTCPEHVFALQILVSVSGGGYVSAGLVALGGVPGVSAEFWSTFLGS